MVKITKFVKAFLLNSSFFSVLCDEMGSKHKQLLLHIEMCWRSHGNLLVRLLDFGEEVVPFLSDCKSEYVTLFSDKNYFATLTSMADKP